jgi:predicted PurR-regulated permease PerM
MTLSLILVIVLPLALVTYNLADNVSRIYEQIRAALEAGGLHPPAWLASIPVVGETIDGYVRRLLDDREELLNLGKTMLEPARHFLARAASCWARAWRRSAWPCSSASSSTAMASS